LFQVIRTKYQFNKPSKMTRERHKSKIVNKLLNSYKSRFNQRSSRMSHYWETLLRVCTVKIHSSNSYWISMSRWRVRSIGRMMKEAKWSTNISRKFLSIRCSSSSLSARLNLTMDLKMVLYQIAVNDLTIEK